MFKTKERFCILVVQILKFQNGRQAVIAFVNQSAHTSAVEQYIALSDASKYDNVCKQANGSHKCYKEEKT